MDFNEFKDEILTLINDKAEESDLGEFIIRPVTKNNGVVLSGLSVYNESRRVSPTVYLEHFYELHESGMTVAEVATKIVETFTNAVNSENTSRLEEDLDLGLSDIIVKLVNYDRNMEMLKRAPHVKVLDLAITFRYYINSFGDGIGSALVTYENLCDKDISTDTLLKLALENTRRLIPENIFGMNEFLESRITEEEYQLLENLGIKILTNTKCIDGASMILYDDLLKDFSDSIDDDFYIIPSSIHEVILVPRTSIPDTGNVEDMIDFVNKNTLEPEEYLSNSLYYYDRALAQITIQ